RGEGAGMEKSHCPACGVEIPAGELCPSCLLNLGIEMWTGAADDDHDAEVQPGSRVGHHVLHAEIACCAQGRVFKARDLRIGRFVALKMLLRGKGASRTEVESLQKEMNRFTELDHPGIVPIYDTGEHEGQPFFTMRLMAGGSVADNLAGFSGDAG